MSSYQAACGRGSSFIFGILIIIIICGSLVCQASSYADTGRLEYSNVTKVEFGKSTSSSSSDGDVKHSNKVLLFIFLVGITIYYCIRMCRWFLRRFSRNESEIISYRQGAISGGRRINSTSIPSCTLFPQTHFRIIVLPREQAAIEDSDPPEYQPPPAYHDGEQAPIVDSDPPEYQPPPAYHDDQQVPILDSDPPEYQPPPTYHESVLNWSDDVPKEDGIP